MYVILKEPVRVLHKTNSNAFISLLDNIHIYQHFALATDE